MNINLNGDTYTHTKEEWEKMIGGLEELSIKNLNKVIWSLKFERTSHTEEERLEWLEDSRRFMKLAKQIKEAMKEAENGK